WLSWPLERAPEPISVALRACMPKTSRHSTKQRFCSSSNHSLRAPRRPCEHSTLRPWQVRVRIGSFGEPIELTLHHSRSKKLDKKLSFSCNLVARQRLEEGFGLGSRLSIEASKMDCEASRHLECLAARNALGNHAKRMRSRRRDAATSKQKVSN